MMKNLSNVFTLVVTGLMILAIPISFTVAGEEESDGTTGTKMGAEAGGSGDFAWNDIHAFYIEENDDKIDDLFNVTVCEARPKDKGTGDGMQPSGYIFGELNDITWDDDPAPTITISSQDFEDYKEDANNLTVYALGKYYDADNPDENERDRWAYKTVTVTKPNNPPTPVARVAEEGNWTWINLTVESEVTFIVEEDTITLWFDASLSWDVDDEDVTGWAWELNGDGKFGGAGETQENVSRELSQDMSYVDLGLKVFDERGKESTGSVDFTIHIESPAQLPDLAVGEINYENKNKNKANYEVTDVIIIQPKIKNIGEKDTENAFSVLIEYSTDNGANYLELTPIEITDPIASNNFQLLTYQWDTGGFTDGSYRIRVTADKDAEVEEEHEDNNQNTTNLISLEPKSGTGTPELSFESLIADRTSVNVNVQVNITVTIKNTGTGDANYVDIKFDINGEYMYFRTIDLIVANTNESIIIPFTGDAKGDYILGFILEDDKTQIGTKQTVTITVTKDTIIIPPDENGDGTGSDGGGFIPGFELAVLMGAVLVGSILFSRRKR